MTIAKHLLRTYKAFHLDKPEATWADLQSHLRAIAEEALLSPQGADYGLVLSDITDDLSEIAYDAPLTLAQAKAVLLAHKTLRAAEERHGRNLIPLTTLLESDLACAGESSAMSGSEKN